MFVFLVGLEDAQVVVRLNGWTADSRPVVDGLGLDSQTCFREGRSSPKIKGIKPQDSWHSQLS